MSGDSQARAAAPEPYIEIADPTGGRAEVGVAGIGARSLAFLVDWHVRVLLATAIWLLALFWGPAFAGPDSPLGDSGEATIIWLVLWLVLPLAIYLLYHPVLEIAMDGRTPGKRWTGIRIVREDGSPAGTGALLVRNIFRIIDSLPTSYALGLLVAMLDGRQRRIGDMAAGTLLVYEDRIGKRVVEDYAAISGNTTLAPADQELLLDLLDRWSALERPARIRLGNRLLDRIGEAHPGGSGERARERMLRERLRELAGRKSHG
ncbi:RDD family protein [Ectothiorhodospiraceae bacterium WFHF3C12]|nr:RDD family protein [Ectothiorhodospiraceae bacterium WFHF3C12]